MHRLNGGDYAQPRHPVEVIGVDVLGMLDPVGRGSDRHPRSLDAIEHLTHGAIADRVDGKRQTGLRRPTCQPLDRVSVAL
jgi:hypothetical protein